MKTIGIVLLFAATLALSLVARPAAAQEASQTQTTDHYTITFTFGPTVTMLTPAQVAAGAKEGEAMVAMPGMTMPEMSMTDTGQAVNHHLEVKITDKASGALVTNMMPTIAIKNQATGESRTLASVAAMYNVQVGQGDTHFGNNVYLADGKYTVTVTVNSETATFTGVAARAAPAPTAMPGMSGGQTMPVTGQPFAMDYTALAVIAGLVIAGGLGMRRFGRMAPRRG